jgi:hypothetical protein
MTFFFQKQQGNSNKAKDLFGDLTSSFKIKPALLTIQ